MRGEPAESGVAFGSVSSHGRRRPHTVLGNG